MKSIGGNRTRTLLSTAMALACLTLAPVLFLRGEETPAGPLALGAGACAAEACHGSAAAWEGKIDRNEYTLWKTKDRHARAYETLMSERSRRIARNLGIEAAHSAQRCLDCHAYSGPAADSAIRAEGVTCEVCHAPSVDWLGPHAAARPVDEGMPSFKDPARQAQLCLSCHLGKGGKSVGHELIAAGHPDLRFEAAVFAELMPAHWRRKETEGARLWLVGQAVALRESLRQLAERAAGGSWDGWPDFADFECLACHHELRRPSLRQQGEYEGIPGLPSWNPSRYALLGLFLEFRFPTRGADLDAAVSSLRSAVQGGLDRRSDVASSALKAAREVERLMPHLAAFEFDVAAVRDFRARIVERSDGLALQGVRTAEQIVLGLDALTAWEWSRTGGRTPQLDAALDDLYDSLRSPFDYRPQEFAAHLKKLPR